jgi:hypothetical protein
MILLSPTFQVAKISDMSLQYLACCSLIENCSQAWWHMPGIPVTWEVKARRIMSFRTARTKLARHYLKNKMLTKGLRTQVVECLPSVRGDLGSFLSTGKKNIKNIAKLG